jgi:hypothetical protein
VTEVTEAPNHFWQVQIESGRAIMKKIFLVLTLAFAFAAVMPVLAKADDFETSFNGGLRP